MPAVSNHPRIDCPLSLRAAVQFSQSENGVPLGVAIIGAMFRVGDGAIVPVEDQPEINLAGEYWGEPGVSSLKLEPQVAFTKLATDVTLIGHAFSRGRASVDVVLRVGALTQTAHVVGDRYWVRSLGMISMTPPAPFERMPLVYERAFGGWDRSHPDPEKHAFEARNPVGTGFRCRQGKFEDGVRLPNLENPKDLVKEYGQSVAPVGFGFLSPDWQPRASFAGTYDEQWMIERMPLLPQDFDLRFFNAASPGLIAAGFLKGDEGVSIENASPRGTVSFNLPGVRPPECLVQLTGKRDKLVQTNLDSVIINTDDDLVLLIWRGFWPLMTGPHDIASIEVLDAGAAAAAAVR